MIVIGLCRRVERDSSVLSLFPAARAEQIARIAHPGRRADSVTATLLLLRMLEAPLPEGLSEISLDGYEPRSRLHDWPLGENGQPFPDGIDVPGGRRYLSLSHAGGWCAVALSDRPVGLDIVPKENFPDAVAARFGWDKGEAPWRFAEREAALKLHGGTLSEIAAPPVCRLIRWDHPSLCIVSAFS